MAQRNFGLDLLRCLAIAMVLVNHGMSGILLPLIDGVLDGPLGLLFIVDYLSIEWLFVLSGFLIGTMLIRSFDGEGTFWTRARSFWLRRWFRTLPNYYLFFLVNLALVWVGIGPGAPDWRYLAFSQNLAWPEGGDAFFIEAWSLALDEWFYLVMPLLVGLASVWIGLPHRTSFLLATGTLIVLPMVGRLAIDPPTYFKEWDHEVRMVTLLHLDATGWGVMAAVAGRWFPALWSRRIKAKAAAGAALMAIGVWLLLGLAVVHGSTPTSGRIGGFLTSWDGAGTFFGEPLHLAFPRAINVLSITLLDVGSVLALPWIASLRPAAEGLRSAVEHVSNYSYSVYLSHFPMAHLLVHSVSAGGHSIAFYAGLLVSWVLLVFGVSALIFHGFEKPVSDLRERFTRKVDAAPFIGARQPETMKGLEPGGP